MTNRNLIKMPAKDDYPSRGVWTMPAFALAVFVSCVLLGFRDRAFDISMITGALFLIIFPLKKYINYPGFWICAFITIAIHVAYGSYVMSKLHIDSYVRVPGIVFLPLLIVDVLIWQYTIILILRLFPWRLPDRSI